MSAAPCPTIYLVVDRYGLPVGGAWLDGISARNVLSDADEERPLRGPHRVVTYRAV